MPSTKSSREPARRDTFCRQATPRETSRRETVAQHAPPHPFAPLPGWSATTSHERLLSLANGLGRTISVARALVSAGRTVDLSGFQESVGVLCAKTLDLHHGESRGILPALLELTAHIDGMSAKITEMQRARGQTSHPPAH